MSMKKGTAKDNKLQNYFTVIDDPSAMFSDGAIFEVYEILGCKNHGIYNDIVCGNDLPEGIEMLYKRNGVTQYRCKFYNGDLHVIAKN